MNKLIVLLLSGLAWVNSARAADTVEYEFTGRVTELTCKVELYSYTGTPLSALYVGGLVIDTLPLIPSTTRTRSGATPRGGMQSTTLTAPVGVSHSVSRTSVRPL